MHFLRKVVVSLASSAFFSFLFLAVMLASISSVVTKPENIKLWLKQSNIYSHIVPDLISINSKNLSKDEQSNSSGEVSLDQPAIKQSAIGAFSPQFLETSVDNIIDGTYHWLDGKTTSPDFKVDATPVKAAFANNVKAYLTGRVSSLPVCKTAVDISTFDAFAATCIPKGVNASSEINRITDDIGGSKDFLPNPILTNDTITTDKNGQKEPISVQYKDLPTYYGYLKRAPLITGFVALLAAVVVIFVSQSKRRGLRRICISLSLISVFLMLSVALTTRINDFAATKIKTADSAATAELQRDGLFIARKISGTINHTNIVFAATFIALAVAGFVYLYVTKPKKAEAPKAEETPELKPKEEEKPKAEEPPKANEKV